MAPGCHSGGKGLPTAYDNRDRIHGFFLFLRWHGLCIVGLHEDFVRSVEMPFGLEQVLGIHEDALRLRTQRAALIAANLANADTPGFKARDIDFASLMSGVSDSLAAPRLSRTHTQHIEGGGSGVGFEPLYRTALQPSVDNNTVDTQVEQAEFLKNAIAYQSSLTFLGGKLRSLRTAIRGE